MKDRPVPAWPASALAGWGSRSRSSRTRGTKLELKLRSLAPKMAEGSLTLSDMGPGSLEQANPGGIGSCLRLPPDVPRQPGLRLAVAVPLAPAGQPEALPVSRQSSESESSVTRSAPGAGHSVAGSARREGRGPKLNSPRAMHAGCQTVTGSGPGSGMLSSSSIARTGRSPQCAASGPGGTRWHPRRGQPSPAAGSL